MERKMLLLALLLGVAFAQDSGITNVKSALESFCKDLKSIVSAVVALLIFAAGVVYAAGQMMGAEMRGRTNMWAQSMILGAIVGLLIIVVLPNVLQALAGSSIEGSISC